MNIEVTMASGDVDTWTGAADAIDDRGSLVILFEIEGDEVPGSMKTLELVREIPQDPVEVEGRLQMPTPVTMTDTYQVVAQYAPGMWMKVEFE